MESVYLKNIRGRSKPIPWCSKKVNLKECFEKYHNALSNVFPNHTTNARDIAQLLIGEEISNEEWRKLNAATDPRRLKLPPKIFVKDKKTQPSSTGEPVTSVENTPSTSKLAISTNSCKKVTKKALATEIGHRQSKEVEKTRIVKKTANKEKNHIVKFQHNAAARNSENKTSLKEKVNGVKPSNKRNERAKSDVDKPDPPDDEMLPVHVKSKVASWRRNRRKSARKEPEVDVHDQSNASLSTPRSDEIPSRKIKDSEIGKNVRVTKSATLSTTLKTGSGVKIRELSRPSTSKENVILESLPSTSKQQVEPASRSLLFRSLNQAIFSSDEESDGEQSTVVGQVKRKKSEKVKKTSFKVIVKKTDHKKGVKRLQKNFNIRHDAANLTLPDFIVVARNSAVQSRTAMHSFEAFEVVVGLLESLIDGVSLRCSSRFSKCSEVKKEAETVSHRYPQRLRKSVAVQQVENADTERSPRPNRKSKYRKIKDVTKHGSGRNKSDEVEETESDDTINTSGSTFQAVEDKETEDEESQREYFKDIIRNLSKKGGKKLTHRKVRGQIIVDTTNRLGKKDLIPRKNFVVTFRIYRPFFQNKGVKNARAGKCVQEMELLNFQTLADLRCKIFCENDYQNLDGEVSEWPFTLREAGPLSGDKYKSAMFYIDNTFYVDTQEGAHDYSSEIRSWAEEHGIKLGEAKPMNETKLEDLTVRFGYPYLFMHQGNCQHIIIISDARLLTENNSLHSSDYPNLTKITRSKTDYCVVCAKTPAQWLVYGSERMFFDINFMCHKCFYGYHYIGTEKIGKFKAYRWKQRSILFY